MRAQRQLFTFMKNLHFYFYKINYNISIPIPHVNGILNLVPGTVLQSYHIYINSISLSVCAG